MLAGGSAALAAADLDRAERTARALIARDPRLAQARTLLGQALTERAHVGAGQRVLVIGAAHTTLPYRAVLLCHTGTM